MISYWEKMHFLYYDYVIIGSGITGLSAVCSIKERQPNASIAVLERGLLPTGATTKNAGFACIGSFTEKWHDLELMGEDAFLQLIEDRWKGLAKLRSRLGDEQIEYANNGGYELLFANQYINEEQLHHMNGLLNKIFNQDVFKTDPSLIQAFGFNKQMLSNVIVNPLDAQINSGKMMRALYRMAASLNTYIATGAEVMNIEETENGVNVIVNNPLLPEPLLFKSNKVAICTNAFTGKFFPELDITPGRGQVIVTEPIHNLKMKGVFSFDEGYYYFRNIDNRILFGGGRNLDFDGETTTEFGPNQKILDQLSYYLHEMILPGNKMKIEQQWSGIMAFGKNKLPLVQKVSEHIAVGARLNGMGIALSSKIGEEIATLLVNG
ncbi:MAG: NAD(P)/FAD-dependent oxidoreductase [Bacteroidota bacterium]|jgi:glycine/D-amino acid oxidase-like deaminating enzyme